MLGSPVIFNEAGTTMQKVIDTYAAKAVALGNTTMLAVALGNNVRAGRTLVHDESTAQQPAIRGTAAAPVITTRLHMILIQISAT